MVVMEKKSHIADNFSSSTTLVQTETTLYKRRWFMLFLFSALGAVSGFQWIEMSILSDVLTDYYQVDALWIVWSTTVWSLTCVFFTIPGAWLVTKFGLRPLFLLCGFLNLFGCLMRTFASGRDQFPLAFAGGTIASLAPALSLGMPPRVASVWFGSTEVSTACGLGVLGFLLGSALGFAVPPFVIVAHEDIEVTKNGIDLLNYSLSALSLLIFVLSLIWYQEEPPTPPSLAAIKQKEDELASDSNFFVSIKELLRTPGYLLVVGAYGLSIGVYNAVSTLLNTIILEFYPNGQKHAGLLGLTMSFTGIVGLFVSGWLLDKTKKFKEVTVGNYLLGLLSLTAFALLLDVGSMTVQYFTIGALGIFLAAAMTIGFDMTTELTFPIPEGTSNGVISAVSQILAVGFPAVGGFLEPKVGIMNCLYGFIALYGLGTVMVMFLPHTYKRQEASKLESSNHSRVGAA